MIKSPLRYPGGKQKAVKFLEPYVPDFKELREPFFGGGSFSIYYAQERPDVKIYANDLNFDLFCFWEALKRYPIEVYEAVSEIRESFITENDGRELYKQLLDANLKSREDKAYISFIEYMRKARVGQKSWNADFKDRLVDKAVAFFILNRITFSGLLEAGGYSKQAFNNRFTKSSIDRMAKVSEITEHMDFTCKDYSYWIKKPGDDVLIFLDPPYLSVTKSKLYGSRGKLHIGFDHHKLAAMLNSTNHKWIMTYDDCSEVRALYKECNINPLELQYSMSSFVKDKIAKGKELVITNF